MTLYRNVGSCIAPSIWTSSYLGIVPLRESNSWRTETGVLLGNDFISKRAASCNGNFSNIMACNVTRTLLRRLTLFEWLGTPPTPAIMLGPTCGGWCISSIVVFWNHKCYEAVTFLQCQSDRQGDTQGLSTRHVDNLTTFFSSPFASQKHAVKITFRNLVTKLISPSLYLYLYICLTKQWHRVQEPISVLASLYDFVLGCPAINN